MSMIRTFLQSHPATDRLPDAMSAPPAEPDGATTDPTTARPGSAAMPATQAQPAASGAARRGEQLADYIDVGVAAGAASDTFSLTSELVTGAAERMATAGEISSRSLGAVRSTLTAVAVPLTAADHYFNDPRVASSDTLHGVASVSKAVADAAAGTVGGLWNVGLGVVADGVTFVAPDSAVAEVVDLAADTLDPSVWLSGGAAALIDTGVVVTEGLLRADEGLDVALAASSRASDRMDAAARDGDYGVAGRVAPAVSDLMAAAPFPTP